MHVLSHEEGEVDGGFKKGYIDLKLLESIVPPVSETNDVLICICGSPPMYKSKNEYSEHSQKRLDRLTIIQAARSKHMKDTAKWIYVQAIGVVPNEVGKGYSKRMMQLLIQTADSLKVPIYLETESEGNEAMYHHFGFQTLENLNVCVPNDTSSTANLTMWLMKKDAK